MTTGLSCSLNDESYQARRLFVRKALLPKIIQKKKMSSGLLLTFKNSEAVLSDLQLFVKLESQCCGFLDFSTTILNNEVELSIEGPPEARDVLATFSAGLSTQ